MKDCKTCFYFIRNIQTCDYFNLNYPNKREIIGDHCTGYLSREDARLKGVKKNHWRDKHGLESESPTIVRERKKAVEKMKACKYLERKAKKRTN